MIVPAYGLTATERVLPRMALDFTTASLDNRVTVTRALNTATRTNSSGIVEIVNANLPRFDFNPVTLACRGLLIEEYRINIVLHSGYDIGLTSVPTRSAGVSAATYDLGLGITTALAIDSTGATQYAYGGPTYAGVAASTQYALSAYVKKSDGTAPTSSQITFVCGNAGSTNWTSTLVGNGVYRISAISTSTTSNLGNTGIAVNTANTGIYYVSGFQCEAGAFATSYIPTTTTSLTRNADDVSMTGTNFSSWWNTDAGTLVVSGSQGWTPNGNIYYVAADSGSAVDRTSITTYATGLYPEVVVNNTPKTINLGNPIVVNTTARIAFAYDAASVIGAVNGNAAVTTSPSITPAAMTRLKIGAGPWGTPYINGYVRQFYYYPLKLTSSEIRAISKG